MKCWELTSLSSSPLRTHQESLKPTSFLLYIFHYSIQLQPHTQSLRRELAHAAKHLSTPNYRMEYWHIEVRCRVVVISQGLQAICRRSLDDRSAQSRYRWWSQEWGWWCSRTWSWGLRSTDIFTSIRKVLSLGRGDWPGLCSSSSPRVSSKRSARKKTLQY